MMKPRSNPLKPCFHRISHACRNWVKALRQRVRRLAVPYPLRKKGA